MPITRRRGDRNGGDCHSGGFFYWLPAISLKMKPHERSPIVFKKILYPTDFSDVATKALDYIKQLKEAGSQEVVILHVMNRNVIDGLMRHPLQENDILQWREVAKEIALESLAEVKKELEGVGFAVKTIFKIGYPWQEILAVEEKEAPSIIAIGSHGRSNIGEIFLGSVSERVIRKSRRPVLVVKRETEI